MLDVKMLLFPLQYECDRCGHKYQTKAQLTNHLHRCTYCDQCRRYLDIRHLETCQGKPLKSEQIRCSVCSKFLTKKAVGRHMKDVHGFLNWSMAQHPDRRTKVG